MRCYHMRVETYSSKNFEKFQEFQIKKIVSKIAQKSLDFKNLKIG